MAITIRGSSMVENSLAGVTSIAVSFTSVLPQAGDAIFVVVGCENGDSGETMAVGELSDNQGLGSWSLDQQCNLATDGSRYDRVGIFSRLNCPSGITNPLTITFTPSEGTSDMLIGAIIGIGVATSSALDAHTQNTGTGQTATTSSTGTLAMADEIAIAGCIMRNQTTSTLTDPSGWTVMYHDSDSSFANGGSAALVVSATTALNPEWVMGATGVTHWGAAIATYKGIGGGSSTGTAALSSPAPSLAGTGLLIYFPAYGYATPDTGELSTSWTTWNLGSGATIGGDANYGDLVIPAGVTCNGPVVDMGEANNKTITVATKYGTNSGSYTRYIRGSATSFAWDAGSPSWTEYTAPVVAEWRYVQMRIVGA